MADKIPYSQVQYFMEYDGTNSGDIVTDINAGPLRGEISGDVSVASEVGGVLTLTVPGRSDLVISEGDVIIYLGYDVGSGIQYETSGGILSATMVAAGYRIQ